jgi:hypothetical protein
MDNLSALTKPIEKLIDSISNAIGVLYEPKRIIKKAKAKSTAQIIQDYTNTYSPEIIERLNQRLLTTEVKRQVNIESVIDKSLQYLPEDSNSELKPDNDWFSFFFENVQDCSREDIQDIWARLLANEVDKPGSISRRTINTIKLISSEEAKLFNKFCKCIWEIKDHEDYTVHAMILDSNNKGEYSEEGWGFSGLEGHKLETLSLIFDDEFQIIKNKELKLKYFETEIIIKSTKKDEWLSILALTDIGKELFNVLKFEPNYEYFNHIQEYLKSRKLK